MSGRPKAATTGHVHSFNCRSSYLGVRYGAEYQGDLNLGPYGGLTFGADETETAHTSQNPNPGDGSFTPVDARQVTNSIYAEDRIVSSSVSI